MSYEKIGTASVSLSTEGHFERMHLRLKTVVERYAFFLTGTRQNSEDISQEVFIKLWIKWERLQRLNDSELKDYLYVMVKNHILNICKKNNTARKRFNLYKNYVQTGYGAYVHDEVLTIEGFRLYRTAVNQLPVKERTVYQYYQMDFSRGEIAGIVHRSENTVNNQIYSARKHVLGYLNKHFDLKIGENGGRKHWKTSLN